MNRFFFCSGRRAIASKVLWMRVDLSVILQRHAELHGSTDATTRPRTWYGHVTRELYRKIHETRIVAIARTRTRGAVAARFQASRRRPPPSRGTVRGEAFAPSSSSSALSAQESVRGGVDDGLAR